MSKQLVDRQLPLALRLDQHARFESFVAAGNEPAIAHLRAVAERARRDLLWFWGEPGTGKSHLLQAACRAATESGRRAMYLQLEVATKPDVISELEPIDLLAIDDLHFAAGDPQWEERLFGLLNGFYRGGGALVLASLTTPKASGFAMPDLASRAAGGVVYRLRALSDEDQLAALIQHAKVRGLELDTEAAGYLFRRVKREISGLCLWLDRLDRESLIAQRRITVPFIRELLQSADGES